LGTVADVVALDQVNRILVHQGLLRIRSGHCHVGIKLLAEIAGRQCQNLFAADLGFAIAPRLNAAGRMDDMSLGIQCLLTDDTELAREIAQQLDSLNQERKEVEAKMKTEAMALLAEMKSLYEKHLLAGVCLYDANWHQGVIGILAARIKDRLHRPVIAFAPADNGEIKGSARSINGVHIRDVLSEIAALHPQMLNKFGGHAMAAGLTLKLHDYPHFALLFAEAVAAKLDKLELQQQVCTDGELDEQHMNLHFAEELQQAAIWGQAFPEPAFNGVFEVIQCRIVGKQHLKFVLRPPFSGILVDAIAFFADQPENWLGCRKINAVYKLDINEFRGQRTVQLQIEYLEKCG
jgi:single-stranded-DNA-specific exonuclease